MKFTIQLAALLTDTEPALWILALIALFLISVAVQRRDRKERR
jgi:hypothetical protein